MRVGELGLLVVDVHQRALPAVDLGHRLADPVGADRQQQVGHGRLGAEARSDHLPHHAQPAAPGDGAGMRHELAGDDPQQGGLPCTVGADERDLGAVADPERHVVEQHPTIGKLEPDAADLYVTHKGRLSDSARLAATGFPRSASAGRLQVVGGGDRKGLGRREAVRRCAVAGRRARRRLAYGVALRRRPPGSPLVEVRRAQRGASKPRQIPCPNLFHFEHLFDRIKPCPPPPPSTPPLPRSPAPSGPRSGVVTCSRPPWRWAG